MSPTQGVHSSLLIASRSWKVSTSAEETQQRVGQAFFPHTIEQLSTRQQFTMTGRLAQAGPITLSDCTYGADLRMHFGELGTAYHVEIPLSGSIQARHRNIDVDGDEDLAVVFRPQGETVVTRWAAQTRGMAVKIDRAAVERTLAQTLPHNRSSDNAFTPSIDLRLGQARSWTRLLRLLINDLADPDSILHQPIAAMPFAEIVVNGFLMLTNPAYREVLEHPAEPCRPAKIRAAIDIIHAEAHTALTTAELARRSHVKSRTLQEGFQRHLGTPPMAYLRSVRLARAHAALRAADPTRDTVTEIAQRWGFTNLTRFANQYRATYGELPSQTLRDRSRHT
jgi:AraC-like DNA-binding protein